MVSSFASNHLICSDVIARRVAALSEPYIRVLGSANEAAWSLHGDAAAIDGEELEVQPLGEMPAVYRVDRQARIVAHVAPAGDEWAAQNLLRAARALHRTHAQSAGMLFLHAALVRIGDLGVLMVGRSRSGKTTMLLTLAHKHGAQIVANDETGVISSGASLEGYGWPRSISIRLDSLELVLGSGAASEILRGLSHPANRSLGQLREQGIEPHGTALMYPFESQDILKQVLIPRARVDAVVFLRLTETGERPEFAVLDTDEAGQRLASNRMTAPNKHLNIFGDVRAPAIETARRALLGRDVFEFSYSFLDVATESDRLIGMLREAVPRVSRGESG